MTRRFHCLILAGWMFCLLLGGTPSQNVMAQPPAGDPFAPVDPFAPAGDNPGMAPNNPFGAPVEGNLFDPAAAPAAAAGQALGEILKPTDPFIEELRRYAAGSNAKLALAIRQAARIGNWKEVEDFLQILAGRKPSQAVLSSMANTIDGPLLARMRLQPKLSPESIKMIDQLRAAAQTSASDNKILQQAILALKSPSVDMQLKGYRALLAGGDNAIAELVTAAVQPNPVVPREKLVPVLREMGPSAEHAIRQFVLYGAPELRAGALETLVLWDRKAALGDLVTALHAADATDKERSIAASTLAQDYKPLPSGKEAEQFLTEKLNDAVRLAKRTDRDEKMKTIWVIGEEGKTISPQLATARLAAVQQAAVAAARLRPLSGLSLAAQRAALITDIDYAVQQDLLFGTDPKDFDSLRESYSADAFSLPQLQSLLSDSVAERRDAATVGILRLLPADPQLVRSMSQDQTPLVDAASHPDPRVRYEASSLIGRTQMDEPYRGSSVVLRRWLEMAALKNRPTALVVQPRPAAAMRLEAMLIQQGYNVEIVPSVQEAALRVARGGDIQVIVATTDLPDLPPIELVDRIRRISFGANIPIIFYGDDRAGTSNNSLSAPVRRIVPPRRTLDQDRYDVLLESLQLLNDDLEFVLFQPPIDVPVNRPDPQLEQRENYAAALAKVRAAVLKSKLDRNLSFFGLALGIDAHPIALTLQPETEGGIAQTEILRASLEDLGFEFESVSDLAALQTRLEDRRPVHMVFLSASSAPEYARDLVNQIRETNEGAKVPIFFYGGSDDGLETARFESPLRRRYAISTPQSFTSVMDSVHAAAALPPLDSDERKAYEIGSMSILSAVAQNPKQEFYDLRTNEIDKVLGAPSSGSNESHLAVLAGLGTAESQDALAELAASESVAQPVRMRAAERFAESVQRFGTRLSRDHVALQYERYNRTNNEDIRASIGIVLDAMEKRVSSTN